MTDVGKNFPPVSNARSAVTLSLDPFAPESALADRDLQQRFQFLMAGNHYAFGPGDFIMMPTRARELMIDAMAALETSAPWVREEALAAMARLVSCVGAGERLGAIRQTVACLSAESSRLRLGAVGFIVGALLIVGTDEAFTEICDLVLAEIQADPVIFTKTQGHQEFETISALIDWTNPKQVSKFLCIIETLLGAESLDIRKKTFFYLRDLFSLWKDFDLFQEILPELWQKFDLAWIEFSDEGKGFSAVTFLLGAYLRSCPDKTLATSPVSIQGMDFVLDHQTSHALGLKTPALVLNRSRLYPLDDGHYLVEKKNREGQSPADLVRELQWVRRITELKLPLKSLMIEPYSFSTDGESVISFKAPKSYYRYINDPDVSDAEFYTGLLNATHDIFLLREYGIYHTIPIALFHDSEGDDRRLMTDRGRYVTMPDLAYLSGVSCGMGDLDAWRLALKYPNIGVSGLRDFEELATLEEIRTGVGRFAPQLKRLLNSLDPDYGARLADALLLQNAVLAGVLLIGERFVGKKTASTKWQDEIILNELKHSLIQLHATAYSVLWKTPLTEASAILADKVDWQRLARQVLFFMSDDYVPFVRPGEAVENFPKEIYSERTRVRGQTRERHSSKIMGPYWPDSFDPKHGFLGTNRTKEQASLGPANGPFPIREFERAMTATLIDWKGLKTKAGRPIRGKRPQNALVRPRALLRRSPLRW